MRDSLPASLPAGPADDARRGSTRERIGRATLDLINQSDGLREVSLRQIAAAANSNVALVSYHYGSKEGLLADLYRTQGKLVAADRAARLTALAENAGITPLLEAWLVPMFTPILAKQHYLALHSFLRLHHPDLYASLLDEVFGPINRRFVAAIRRALPRISERSITWRLYALAGSTFLLLDRSTRVSAERFSGGLCGAQDDDACLRELVKAYAAGFAAE